ncbi:MAG TPA: universal stress protein [Arthrobacter sp.]|nr:universal stress protein [Arthrobacter sp.]
MKVLIWLTAGAWEACVDAARSFVPAAVSEPGGELILLHVLDDGVFAGRPGPDARLFGSGRSSTNIIPVLDAEAALLDAAAHRLGAPARRETRRGRLERKVVAAAADADLLVCARDGDLRHPGPRSLSPATRFVVDHVLCPVLLVWPSAPPTGATPLELAAET